MIVRTALVDKRAGTSIISRLSRSLAIITTISITSIACKTLCGSVCISSGISWLSISRPLAIIPTIAIASQALGCSIHRAASTIGMIRNSSISWLSLALAITIATITIATIAIATIASQALGSSVDRAAATIGVKSH